jgi:transketolase
MGSDWDNRWRTGGSIDEVMDEAHLTPPFLLAGIERFVRERTSRLRRVHEALDAAESHGAGGSAG